jgi:predicted ABC-type ATPase
MSNSHPHVIVLAGPNGAGKSTAAPLLLQRKLSVEQFVNADVIAQGLAGFAPESVAIDAGRVMLTRLKELAAARVSFAFETTLASRTFAPWLKGLLKSGYHFHLVFLWLPQPEMAVARVANRVRLGGHSVPTAAIRRRYHTGLRNFFHLYQPLTTSWRMYDNSSADRMELIAAGRSHSVTVVKQLAQWQAILRENVHDS